MAIGPAYEKYLDVVLNMLVQASQIQVDRVSYKLNSNLTIGNVDMVSAGGESSKKMIILNLGHESCEKVVILE